MATSDFQENFFHCPICTEKFRHPKVLHCQHTFCKTCIHSYIRQEVAKTPGRHGFACPICRTFTQIRNPSVPYDKWSDSLITNFNLINMMEATESVKEVKCLIHKKTVEYFCKGHEKTICSDCAIFDHRNCDITALAATKKHEKLLGSVSECLLEASQLEKKNLESISALTESKNIMERILKDHFSQMKERIDTAEKDQINMLQCKYDCEVFALKEKQEKCQNLSENLQATMEELRQRKGDSSTNIGHCEDNVLDLKGQLETALKSIRDKREIHISLKSDVDLESRIEKLSNLVGEVIVNISSEEHQSGVAAGRGPLQPPALGSRFMYQNGTMDDVGLPSYTMAVQQLGPMLSTPPGAPGLVHVVHPGSMMQPPAAGPQQIFPLGPFGPTSNAPKSLVPMTSFNAKRPSDKTHCWLTGASFLSNDNIVMADKNNKKVKLFSNTFYCIAEMAMQTYPFDLAETCTGEIAVTLPKQNRVGFFHLETLTPCSHYIDTEQPCLGITSGHERLYICCDTTWSKNGCIRVYDKFNQLLIKIEKDDRGKDMVSVTDYLTVCPLSGNLFFKRGGLSKECIHCTTNQGTILWKAKVPSWMDVPAGLAVLNDGLIVSIGSLKWISPGGQKWEKLIDSSDVSGPCALSVSHDKTRLLVTQADAISNCKENDEVRIFNIMYQFG
ncbi:tripartite motif-containing protein 3-like [Mizuhopecten yessoensis]|uniref:Tripartite motif-containing protein 3 n=1 Tax=Mizuhopecten yessoensis TaxID=6573 RepID=A0A210Q0A3_MIZYE|nr:tripartite motif-containing protein 3-like [Mizuhopecten yessoensis]XP_021370701.1 tripartite motif-containing protein 3-like [Mizuhopecten yessoensis]XP_021370702.1 tripartite motif-containing protein 3-like [Mizuhopecten yessoensis]OWF42156.1 Tripartite motif-containing protein 3 [Mizuhopecten yessoensis]